MSTFTTILDLRSRCHELSKELAAMQAQHEKLNASNAKHFQRLAEDSIKGLFEVINCVKKADKNLIDWHYRSDGLKRILCAVGLDRRTTAVVEKKTQKLKAKVSVVESKFDSAEHAVTTGLRATEDLKSQFVRFSQHSVDPVSRDMQTTRGNLDSNHEKLVRKIERQRQEQSATTTQMQETSESLARTAAERELAERNRDLFAKGAVLGFGAAAISAVLFPPSLLITASALAAGTGAGALAVTATGDAMKHGAEQQRLTASLSLLEQSIMALESKLCGLDTSRHEHAEAIALLEKLQAETGRFRASVQANLDQARTTKLYLNKTRSKLADIINKLHECQYEETRRSIANRLREVTTMVLSGPTEQMRAIKRIKVQTAMQYLLEIDKNTVEVVKILAMEKACN